MANKTKYLLFGGFIYCILYGLYIALAVFFSNTIIEQIIYLFFDYITPIVFVTYCFYILCSNLKTTNMLLVPKFLLNLGSVPFFLHFYSLFYISVITDLFNILISILYIIFIITYIFKLHCKRIYKILLTVSFFLFLFSGFLILDKPSFLYKQALDYCSDSGICKEGLVLIDENGNDWIINKENCALEGRWNDAEKECIMNWSVNY